MEASVYQWAGFLVLVTAMLAVDLGVMNRGNKEVSFRLAMLWTVVWIGVALLFNVWVYFFYGHQPALEFLTGYIVEKALSVDNLFVFLVLFSYFGVERHYQHKVLFYGIVGAVVMRGIFIYLGVEIITNFHFVLYLFGALLIYTGAKLFFHDVESQVEPEKNPIFRFFKRIVPSVNEYHGPRFFIRKDGKHYATPLFFVLVAVETTDLVFATDSIPAIFAITQDPFIIFSSNILAVLGLRALFFVLSNALSRLRYLHYGLATVLIYIGFKMLITDLYQIPIHVSLGIIVLTLGGAIGASLLNPKVEAK